MRKRREGDGTYLEGGQVGEKAVEEAKRKGLEDLRASGLETPFSVPLGR